MTKYHALLNVRTKLMSAGLMAAIMAVFELPPVFEKENFNTQKEYIHQSKTHKKDSHINCTYLDFLSGAMSAQNPCTVQNQIFFFSSGKTEKQSNWHSKKTKSNL